MSLGELHRPAYLEHNSPLNLFKYPKRDGVTPLLGFLVSVFVEKIVLECQGGASAVVNDIPLKNREPCRADITSAVETTQ